MEFDFNEFGRSLVSEQQVSSGAVSGAIGQAGRESDYFGQVLNLLPGLLDTGANVYLQKQSIEAASEKYKTEQRNNSAWLQYQAQSGGAGGYGSLLLVGGALIGGLLLVKALK